jgi:hypothetical protein
VLPVALNLIPPEFAVVRSEVKPAANATVTLASASRRASVTASVPKIKSTGAETGALILIPGRQLNSISTYLQNLPGCIFIGLNIWLIKYIYAKQRAQVDCFCHLELEQRTQDRKRGVV